MSTTGHQGVKRRSLQNTKEEHLLFTPRKRKSRWEYEPFNDGTRQCLETGDYNVKCTGYRRNHLKWFLLHLISLGCLGIPYLLLKWYPQYWAKIAYDLCSLATADSVVVRSRQGKVMVCPIEMYPVRHFDYQLHRYVWNAEKESFVLLSGLNGTLIELIEESEGVSRPQREFKLQLHGRNLINIEVKSYIKLLIDEILNPFYIFEILSAILWSFDEYYHYAICVIFLSAISIATSLYQCRKQTVMLKEMVAVGSRNYVSVYDENDGIQLISSEDLVPGDVILIPPQGCKMTCDALLLTGTCIVNESVLTGEGTPVTKTPALYLDEFYDPTAQHSRHTLYCGTTVIQTRFYHHDKVTAVVVRTGNMTAKGQLVRSILFPKSVGFDFYRDAIRFVFTMFIIASVGCAYSAYLFIVHGASLETILLRSLDIVTIVVPPALPAAMTVGTVYSQNRLKRKGIFCTAPSRINVAGKVKLVCFDKTGTLTEEGLSVWGALLTNGRSLADLQERPSSLPIMSPFLHAMATCHSLTLIDGQLTGDPLDISMFQSIEWDLQEPGKETNRFDMLAPTIVHPTKWQFHTAVNQAVSGSSFNLQVPLEIGILRQFPFNANAQSMSVITRTLGARTMTLYSKGAPERILSICKKKSVPDDISVSLSYYTSSGFRVIAMAYKELPRRFTWLQAQKASREQVETDLDFLGLLLMQNTLKPQSAPVIRELQQARIKCLMLTGDNMLTAVSVSRDCGLLTPSTPLSQVVVTKDNPQTVKLMTIHSSTGHTEVEAASALAVDGTTWAEIVHKFPALVPLVATRGVIFARMSPQQKAHVVETLQSLDYIVAMVGDGANDCGALKTAHIGISLSAAEASIAAPFTSTIPDVTCVPALITEGRCALVTSFGLFNFMAMYSLLQFISVIVLYLKAIEMGTMEFLYVDLVITTVLAVVMGMSGPRAKLDKERPLSNLISPSNLIPLALQVMLAFIAQVVTLRLLKDQHWFVPVDKNFPSDEDTVVLCWENTAVFLVSCNQYLVLAIIYSKGKPHRQPMYKNWLLVLTLLGLMVVNSVLLLVPWENASEFFELEPVILDETYNFRLTLLGLSFAHLVGAVLVEKVVAKSAWLKWIVHKIGRKRKFKNRYKIVEKQILNARFWDPLSV